MPEDQWVDSSDSQDDQFERDTNNQLDFTGVQDLEYMQQQQSDLVKDSSRLTHEQVLLKQLIDFEIKKKKRSLRLNYQRRMQTLETPQTNSERKEKWIENEKLVTCEPIASDSLNKLSPKDFSEIIKVTPVKHSTE